MELVLIQKCHVARPGPKKASRAKLGLSGQGTCWVTEPGSKISWECEHGAFLSQKCCVVKAGPKNLGERTWGFSCSNNAG